MWVSRGILSSAIISAVHYNWKAKDGSALLLGGLVDAYNGLVVSAKKELELLRIFATAVETRNCQAPDNIIANARKQNIYNYVKKVQQSDICWKGYQPEFDNVSSPETLAALNAPGIAPTPEIMAAAQREHTFYTALLYLFPSEDQYLSIQGAKRRCLNSYLCKAAPERPEQIKLLARMVAVALQEAPANNAVPLASASTVAAAWEKIPSTVVQTEDMVGLNAFKAILLQPSTEIPAGNEKWFETREVLLCSFLVNWLDSGDEYEAFLNELDVCTAGQPAVRALLFGEPSDKLDVYTEWFHYQSLFPGMLPEIIRRYQTSVAGFMKYLQPAELLEILMAALVFSATEHRYITAHLPAHTARLHELIQKMHHPRATSYGASAEWNNTIAEALAQQALARPLLQYNDINTPTLDLASLDRAFSHRPFSIVELLTVLCRVACVPLPKILSTVNNFSKDEVNATLEEIANRIARPAYTMRVKGRGNPFPTKLSFLPDDSDPRYGMLTVNLYAIAWESSLCVTLLPTGIKYSIAAPKHDTRWVTDNIVLPPLSSTSAPFAHIINLVYNRVHDDHPAILAPHVIVTHRFFYLWSAFRETASYFWNKTGLTLRHRRLLTKIAFHSLQAKRLPQIYQPNRRRQLVSQVYSVYKSGCNNSEKPLLPALRHFTDELDSSYSHLGQMLICLYTESSMVFRDHPRAAQLLILTALHLGDTDLACEALSKMSLESITDSVHRKLLGIVYLAEEKDAVDYISASTVAPFTIAQLLRTTGSDPLALLKTVLFLVATEAPVPLTEAHLACLPVGLHAHLALLLLWRMERSQADIYAITQLACSALKNGKSVVPFVLTGLKQILMEVEWSTRVDANIMKFVAQVKAHINRLLLERAAVLFGPNWTGRLSDNADALYRNPSELYDNAQTILKIGSYLDGAELIDTVQKFNPNTPMQSTYLLPSFVQQPTNCPNHCHNQALTMPQPVCQLPANAPCNTTYQAVPQSVPQPNYANPNYFLPLFQNSPAMQQTANYMSVCPHRSPVNTPIHYLPPNSAPLPFVETPAFVGYGSTSTLSAAQPLSFCQNMPNSSDNPNQNLIDEGLYAALN